MTNSNENSIQLEQIKNNSERDPLFRDKLISFLEKDEYNVFKTKSKNALVNKLKITEQKIQRLLNLKLKSENVIKQLLKKKKNLTLENSKRRASLIKKLDLEII